MIFKEAYYDQWAKAAKNVLFVLEQIGPLISYPFCLKPGFAATSDKLEDGEHEKGEPDIFVRHKAKTIAAIEVTGSDKVRFPCRVWVAEHKLEYARKCRFPIAYVLVFSNEVRFITARIMQKIGTLEEKQINGISERYRTIGPYFVDPFASLKVWLKEIIKEAAEK